MRVLFSLLIVIGLISNIAAFAEDQENLIEQQTSSTANSSKEKTINSAQVIKLKHKIERLEYLKSLKLRELDYLQKTLEEKKQKLEKFPNTENKEMKGD